MDTKPENTCKVLHLIVDSAGFLKDAPLKVSLFYSFFFLLELTVIIIPKGHRKKCVHN